MRHNAEARWDTAVVMAELSGFTTISPHALAEWEAYVALTTIFDIDLDIPQPDVFGWGHLHCMTGVEQPYVMADRHSGGRLDFSTFGEGQREHLARLESLASYRIELAVLALTDPALSELGLPVQGPMPSFGEERFAAGQEEIREAIEKHGRSPNVVRKLVGALGLKDSLIELFRGAEVLGVDLESAIVEFTNSPRSGRVDALWALLSAMPIQGVFSALQLRGHLKPDFNWKKSDCMDMFTVAHVLPFADCMVVDKAMHDLCIQAGVSTGARLFRSVPDLTAALRRETKGSGTHLN